MKGHGDVKHWDYPMLRGDLVQASCVLCHEKVKGLRGAETVSFGIETLERKGCYGCHKIAGYEDISKIGPVLSGIGTKVNYTWEVNWLKDPKKRIAHSTDAKNLALMMRKPRRSWIIFLN